jgi:cytoskeleton protein RodZ
MSNFGAGFRKARESSGIPLEKIAAETRISSRFLTAIENEDFHLLPGGVFNRGFIRAFAERIGLDPEQALADYDRISVAVEEPAEGLRNGERASVRKTERSLYPIAAGILLLLVAVFYVVTRNGGTGAAAEPAPPAVTEQPAAPAPTPDPPVEPPLSEITTNTEAAAITAPPPVPVPIITPVPVQTPVQTPAPTPAPAPQPPRPAAATPAAGPAALVLDLDVKDLSWVRITADGNVVLNDNLTAGSTRRFTAASSIDVSIGNAGGTSLKINGREIPALGGAGRVREFTITPENAARIR